MLVCCVSKKMPKVCQNDSKSLNVDANYLDSSSRLSTIKISMHTRGVNDGIFGDFREIKQNSIERF